ncbi:MAG: 5,10-methylenetetrahydrofolate reductase [Candidatus Schekmanbacteria bacterium RIFCSPHIGHO2_02_FULL_38_11]|uniref:Methylenetetrahydrofolate reductase n=1 Tax=Candidatus Schekmanbacteria bacterium RIFCSPLOWO2_12_FULL_38_15 TaxID=1817883 RepID=A0A1F7SH08_9BACT|nr:MAG: 5,10-methylenetetrahydrofolate reductase [Candidatus Schekmanbacteria bacterium GWA2_38_9]OGL50593.1 MAG: 5,10-methylenetetrahydrofolate reductase [Candidatus Schekmanbacteria bacterium RIFCSPLOWO2_02_FULL_38_14]OGL52457.1 MAG: 5,10-methylenetetrahydrofolate reductase [Candidatus Schekmanbacteria bacterium RIFCSPLOWO2_12_FULL_38_15]OGL52911.1 MAG: 5,10-methylenetetrahydrofolate reductase [Candidatus Schekmanbacteria bacterium RIFCSPHIGHO2_02_FULL_38_11]
MSLKNLFEKGKFVLTAEVEPPKGTDVSKIFEISESLRGKVDGLNITDQQSAVMRLGSLASCHLLIEKGFEVIFQVTCRDRNCIALQSDLLSASVLGIENVLILTGDHPQLGDHPDSKPVFDLDSVQLLQIAKTLEGGHDFVGNKLMKEPNFFLGAAINPGADPIEPEIIKAEKKVKAGASFFQTQAIYDSEKFKQFIEKTKHLNVFIMAGIVLLKSAKMARYMNEKIAGVCVSDDIIERMEKADDKRKECIEISVSIIKGIQDFCHGIHFMALGWEDLIPEIIKRLNLGK